MAFNPPYVEFPLVDGGSVAIQNGLTSVVRPDAANGAFCFAQTVTADGNDTWHIADTAENVANALAAASGGGGGGGGGSLRAQASVDSVGGFLYGSGANLSPAAPHVPGSGDYAYTVGGAPAAFVLQATLAIDPPDNAVVSAFLAGPNIILIKVRSNPALMPMDLPFNLSVFAI